MVFSLYHRLRTFENPNWTSGLTAAFEKKLSIFSRGVDTEEDDLFIAGNLPDSVAHFFAGINFIV
jgi:hypothetical protein